MSTSERNRKVGNFYSVILAVTLRDNSIARPITQYCAAKKGSPRLYRPTSSFPKDSSIELCGYRAAPTLVVSATRINHDWIDQSFGARLLLPDLISRRRGGGRQ